MRKKVLITGASKGLGRTLAECFKEANFDVIITYKTSEKEALELKEKLTKSSQIDVETYKVDLENEEEIDELFAKIDRLDILINNAAYNEDKDLFTKSQKDFLKTLNVNLVGPFLLSKKAYPLLKKSKGSIVNIASTNGIDTMYSSSIDYDVSKAGLINLTKSLASSFGPNVRVNAVAPGWIETHKTEDMNPKFKSLEEEKIVMGRFANAREIAETVLFVAIEATYMTGSIIRIDGGTKYGD